MNNRPFYITVYLVFLKDKSLLKQIRSRRCEPHIKDYQYDIRLFASRKAAKKYINANPDYKSQLAIFQTEMRIALDQPEIKYSQYCLPKIGI